MNNEGWFGVFLIVFCGGLLVAMLKTLDERDRSKADAALRLERETRYLTACLDAGTPEHECLLPLVRP